jgi:hypothetical protein
MDIGVHINSLSYHIARLAPILFNIGQRAVADPESQLQPLRILSILSR